MLAAAYTAMVPLTIACLTMAVALGLGTGAVFKLVPEWFPDRVGAVTGVVGAAGGLGGFFPPLVMGIVKSATGGYALGFVLMALVAVACLVVLGALRGPPRLEPARPAISATPDRAVSVSATGWLAVRWLHVLAMALFVGGQLVLVVAVIPALRTDQRPALRAVARRFGWASLAALGVLIATGSALASHDMRWDSGTLQVKLALVVGVAAADRLAPPPPRRARDRGSHLPRLAGHRLARARARTRPAPVRLTVTDSCGILGAVARPGSIVVLQTARRR